MNIAPAANRRIRRRWTQRLSTAWSIGQVGPFGSAATTDVTFVCFLAVARARRSSRTGLRTGSSRSQSFTSSTTPARRSTYENRSTARNG